MTDGSTVETKWPSWHCPDHGGPLASTGSQLACEVGHVYPITAGIPRFVSDANYAANFGAQWNRHRRTQLDSESGTTLSRDRLRRCIGEGLWGALSGAQVLEAGCGAGRFTEVLLDCRAFVTSIDLSTAVEANLANFPDAPRHRVAQADIGSMPFAPGGFDLVLCLGVVQHTPDPDATLRALYSHVRPGGYLVIDHYQRGKLSFLSSKTVFRQTFMRQPLERSAKGVQALVDVFLPLHRRVHRIRVLRSIVGRISPIVQYYGVYPDLSDKQQHEWAVLDTHDALTDRFKHRRTASEIQSVLADLGATIERCEDAGNGIEVRARCPTGP